METKKSKNPPAFPLIADDYIQDGMTLRDYFAAKAIMLVEPPKTYVGDAETNQSLNNFCKRVYDIADAMLKEREKNV